MEKSFPSIHSCFTKYIPSLIHPSSSIHLSSNPSFIPNKELRFIDRILDQLLEQKRICFWISFKIWTARRIIALPLWLKGSWGSPVEANCIKSSKTKNFIENRGKTSSGSERVTIIRPFIEQLISKERLIRSHALNGKVLSLHIGKTFCESSWISKEAFFMSLWIPKLMLIGIYNTPSTINTMDAPFTLDEVKEVMLSFKGDEI